MKRRHFLIGATAAAAALVWWKRPGDRGQPYDAYFSALNRELARNGPMRPVMVIDLDRLDRNIDRVASTLRDAGKHYRIVAKQEATARPCLGDGLPQPFPVVGDHWMPPHNSAPVAKQRGKHI